MAKKGTPYQGGSNVSPQMAANTTPIISKSGVMIGQSDTQISTPTEKVGQKFKPGLYLNQGKHVVKGYSITEDQLENLSSLGKFTSIFLAITTFCIAQVINIVLALTAPQWIPWFAVAIFLTVLAVVFGFLAKFFYDNEGRKIRAIKENTTFPE